MSDPSRWAATKYDQPLFVLRYRRSRLIFRIVVLSLGFLLFLGMAMVIPLVQRDRLVFVIFGEVFLGLFLALLLLQIIDLVLFKEIRLYQDRIVKVWRTARGTEIELANAMLRNICRGINRVKSVCKQDTNRYLVELKGVAYHEELADPDEVRRLNHLLAAVSGRRLKEIEESSTIRPLIKEGHSPRAINDLTLDEKELREDRAETEFNRIANRVIILWFIWMMLVPIILLFYVTWRAIP